ncbi:response regulator [Lyngbya aestuarii]|uniref:response regulator n=1 Tax=Lyngbya aestuarii TaxID=118322 RepID=UPI00403D870E
MNNPLPEKNKGKILVVDDSATNLQLLVNILSARNYQVQPALNGRLALSVVRSISPDLILLDTVMQDIDGYQVCEQLKANEVTRDIPVIFISDLNNTSNKIKALDVGGVDYITTPFQAAEILARVETHLAMRRLEKRLKDKNEALAKALRELKVTQNKLIESEKIAALGKLIAGIVHELNTSLAVIRSSVDNITEFLSKQLEQLPDFFRGLSTQEQEDFFILFRKAIQQDKIFSSREKRQFKKKLIEQFTSENITNADLISDTLVDIGIYNDVESFLPFLKKHKSQNILNEVYQFTNLQRSVKTILIATDKAVKVVSALKIYASYQKSDSKMKANIIQGIENVLTLYQHQLKQGVEVIKNYDALPPIDCYPYELNQVWINLVHNALWAMNNQGILRIDVKQRAQNVEISITDSGAGIPQGMQQKIFRPFFTTKFTEEVNGLGLDIVKRIVEKHQGKILVDSIPSKTTFTIVIPIKMTEESHYEQASNFMC